MIPSHEPDLPIINPVFPLRSSSSRPYLKILLKGLITATKCICAKLLYLTLERHLPNPSTGNIQHEFILYQATALNHTACSLQRLLWFLPAQHNSAEFDPPNIVNTPSPRWSTRQKMGRYGGLVRLGDWSWSAPEW